MSDEEAIASKFRRLVELREARDNTKVTADAAEKDYREYEAELVEEIEESPMKGTRKFDLGPPFGTVSFTPRQTNFGRIIDADAAAEFFDSRGEAGEMVKVKIEKGKLNERVRELLEQGKPMPAGIDFYTNRGITITRKK